MQKPEKAEKEKELFQGGGGAMLSASGSSGASTSQDH